MKGVLKKVLIGVAAVIVIIIIYSLVSGKKAPEPTGSLSSTSGTTPTESQVVPTDDQVGNEFLVLLQSIELLRLNDSVFTHPVFLKLKSISITLPGVTEKGRPNPFAPIGAGQLPAAAGAATITTGTEATTSSLAPSTTPAASAGTDTSGLAS